MTPELLRSVALAATVLGPLAAHCGLDTHGFGAVPVELRSARAAVCGTSGGDVLGRATGELNWTATTTVEHHGGYALSTVYALAVEPEASRIDIVLPEGATAARATDVSYFCPLLGHEIGHLVVAQDAARRVAGTERARGASLDEARRALEERVARIRATAIQGSDRGQVEYDALTHHGADQHAIALVRRDISAANVTGCR